MKRPRFENDLDGGVRVKYKGEKYTTGNRRHELVELYKDGKFVRTVKISKVKKI